MSHVISLPSHRKRQRIFPCHEAEISAGGMTSYIRGVIEKETRREVGITSFGDHSSVKFCFDPSAMTNSI